MAKNTLNLRNKFHIKQNKNMDWINSTSLINGLLDPIFKSQLTWRNNI